MNVAASFRSCIVALLLCVSCCIPSVAQLPGNPHLVKGVRAEDVVIHSTAIQRDMTYRVILPETVLPGAKLPVVFLLHGTGSDYRNWSGSSDIAELSRHGVILVMPDTGRSLYVNSITNKNQRDEDYFTQEIIPDVRRRFPASDNPALNAIVGFSKGGYGAMVLALRHPELFSFAGSMSGALEMAQQASLQPQSPLFQVYLDTYGPVGSEARRKNDPFQLIQDLPRSSLPYIFLTAGYQDPFTPITQRFAKALKAQGIPFEMHMAAGDHDWNQWNRQIPGLKSSLLKHFAAAPKS